VPRKASVAGRRGRLTAVALVSAASIALGGCGAPNVPSDSSAPPLVGPLPTSTGPTAVGPATVRGALPIKLTLPAVDITSNIERVGADNQVLQIPSKLGVVGWWQDGVGVGAGRGTVVLVAHVDSPTGGAGPFAQAENLKPGDAMTVTDYADQQHQYQLASVTTYKKETLPYDRIFSQTGPERVAMVLCGGDYDSETGVWDSNVLLTFNTSPVSSGPAASSASPSPSPGTGDGPPVLAQGQDAFGLSLTAVGDSVLLGAEYAVTAKFPRSTVDADESRQSWVVFERIKKRRAAGKLGDVVVIHTGTNGTIDKDAYDRVLRLLADRSRVVLVTVKASRSWTQADNTMIRRLAAKYADGNVRLADWQKLSASHPSWFYTDGIHVKPPGAKQYAKLIREALSQ
jgi:Sortase domain